MRKNRVEEWADNRWPWILAEMGIDPKCLVNNHGPCPICGGKDRFRFDNKRGKGTWFCNACGSGDGFDLLEKALSLTFKTVAERIKQFMAQPEPRKEDRFREEPDVESRRQALNRLWRSAKAPALLVEYLRGRGLTKIEGISNLRGHKSLTFFDKKVRYTTLPGVVGVISDKNGRPISLHRTYLLPDGKRIKRLMPGTEKIMGAAIRLFPPNNKTLVVGEGIETALAGRELMLRKAKGDVGCWSAVTANMLKSVDLPRDVENLVVCVDNDASYTGQAAGFELARRFGLAKPANFVVVCMPAKKGKDMLDVLNGECGAIWSTNRDG